MAPTTRFMSPGAPVFRFAPSPNGELHLGHAYSALLNAKLAKAAGGRLLLRLEDIDLARCTAEFASGILRDLAWLGLRWEEPVRRQSEHFTEYRGALERLTAEGLVYPAFMSRGEMRASIAEAERKNGAAWPRDPDGAPHYPPTERDLSPFERRRRISGGAPFAWRLNVDAARAKVGGAFTWTEFRDSSLAHADPASADPGIWGDVVLARRDIPTSYHLSVVIDDALQGVTHVVRGCDLYLATGMHRLLQDLLGLRAPAYLHHRLILDASGRKLSKSAGDTSLRHLRAAGVTPRDVLEMLELQAWSS